MSFQDLHHEFRIGRSTINEFVPEVLSALYACLSAKYLKVIINITLLQTCFSQFPVYSCRSNYLNNVSSVLTPKLVSNNQSTVTYLQYSVMKAIRKQNSGLVAGRAKR